MKKNITEQKGFAHLILLLVVVAALAVGGYLVWSGKLSVGKLINQVKSPLQVQPDTVPVVSSEPPAEVSITAKGFNPETITVKKGQAITFTNTDSGPHRVASDPHPTHTGLAGFDSAEPLRSKGSFTFTFEKSGTFTYHDHLNPLKFKGTVIVE